MDIIISGITSKGTEKRVCVSFGEKEIAQINEAFSKRMFE